MKNVSSPTIPVPKVVGMEAASPIDIPKLHTPGGSDRGRKAQAYRAACKTTSDLATARKKCRDLVDAALGDAPEGAALLARAIIEVGAAASRDLGDPANTAFLLGHLSRRIRESSYFDF